MQKSLNKQIIITTIFLVVIIALFELTSLDILLQEKFFQIDTNSWILNRDEPILKFIFYDGIKKLLITFALGVLLCLIIFWKKEFIQGYKKGMIIVILSSIIVPLSIGSLKAVSNTPCPKNIEHFGGNYPNIKVFDSYPEDFVQNSKIKCWPAGHASGGFALMSLFFLFKKRRNKVTALIFALFVGWSMGNYKMLIGDHFLSHTIITMTIAWLIILILAKIILKEKLEKSTQI